MKCCLIELPKSQTKEQIGIRPGLILCTPLKSMPIIIPLTSNLKAKRFPFTVSIKPNHINGLESESICLLFQLRAIDQSRIIKYIGEIDLNSSSILKKIASEMIKHT